MTCTYRSAENVDITQEHRAFNAVEFCAGYAGIHLGLKRAIPSLRVIAFSEIEAFACANLVAKMEAGLLEPAPIWTNLKTFPGGAFRGKVGILVAGYPCQPFSAAGKRLGSDDPRHLWPYVREQIQLMQPELCFFENVDGHISMGLREVLADLRCLGYQVENGRGEPTWGVFSAAEVGAPHQRKRVFILAVRGDLAHDLGQRVEELGDGFTGGEELAAARDCGSPLWPSRPGERQQGREPPRTVTQTDLGNPWVRTANRHGVCLADDERRERERGSGFGDSWGLGEQEDIAQLGGGRGGDDEPEEAQPPLGGDLDGAAYRLDYAERTDNRVDELRLLGNGVVPATAEKAFRTLYGRFFGRS